jgi:DHA2 family multidrug resistance protein
LEGAATLTGSIDPATRAFVAPLIERAALAAAINEAWILIAALTLVVILALPLVCRRSEPALEKTP